MKGRRDRQRWMLEVHGCGPSKKYQCTATVVVQLQHAGVDPEIFIRGTVFNFNFNDVDLRALKS